MAGRPLYQHGVEAALGADIPEVVISTDIDDILTASHPDGVRTSVRPVTHAGDDVAMIDVVLDLLDNDRMTGLMVLLQPTSPLRTAAHVAKALSTYRTGGFDMVMSVTELDRAILKAGCLDDGHYRPINDPSFTFANRQSLPRVYRHNGAIYVFDCDWMRQNRSFESQRIGVVEMAPECSVDVDAHADLQRCEELLARKSTSMGV